MDLFAPFVVYVIAVEGGEDYFFGFQIRDAVLRLDRGVSLNLFVPSFVAFLVGVPIAIGLRFGYPMLGF